MRTLHFLCGTSISLLFAYAAGFGCSSSDTSTTTGAPATTSTVAAGTGGGSTTAGTGGMATTAGTGGMATTAGTGGMATTAGTGGTSTVGTGGSGGSGPACSGATPVALTVKNYDGWCTVGVNGGAASPALAQTVCVAEGMIPVTATANAGFKLGLWHHTTGDSGTGNPGTLNGAESDAKVTVGASAMCAWVCCPFTAGNGCDNLPNQCP